MINLLDLSISDRHSIKQDPNGNNFQNYNQPAIHVQQRQSTMSKYSTFQVQRLSNKFKSQMPYQNQQKLWTDNNDLRNSLFTKINHAQNQKQIQVAYSQSSQTSKWTDIQKRKKIPKQLKQFIKKKADQSSNYFQRTKSIRSISSARSVNSSDKFFDIFKKNIKHSCQICSKQLQQSSLISLSNCQHKFCADCLNYYVLYKIKMFQEMTCPDESCDILMSQNYSLQNDQKLYSNIKMLSTY